MTTLELTISNESANESSLQAERHRRNSEWLQAHWGDLLPRAKGQFVAVAGETAFLAATAQDAWAWVAVTHPEDTGAIVRHIRAQEGPRIYGHRG